MSVSIDEDANFHRLLTVLGIVVVSAVCAGCLAVVRLPEVEYLVGERAEYLPIGAGLYVAFIYGDFIVDAESISAFAVMAGAFSEPLDQ